jgi:hypothetical protein
MYFGPPCQTVGYDSVRRFTALSNGGVKKNRNRDIDADPTHATSYIRRPCKNEKCQKKRLDLLHGTKTN